MFHATKAMTHVQNGLKFYLEGQKEMARAVISIAHIEVTEKHRAVIHKSVDRILNWWDETRLDIIESSQEMEGAMDKSSSEINGFFTETVPQFKDWLLTEEEEE